MRTIQEAISVMLKENTGSHMLDSGGAYGRNWERNQEKNFEDELVVDVWGLDETGDYCISVSVYHYLTGILDTSEISEAMNRKLDEIREVTEGDEYPHWVQEVASLLEDEDRPLFDGEIENLKDVWNTYNGENNLSQVLLFQTFTIGEQAYVILQIHGGCDVRGGYTNAQIFELNGYLTSTPDIYGDVDGVQVDSNYNGYSFTDEDGEQVKIFETSETSFELGEMDFTYIYFE